MDAAMVAQVRRFNRTVAQRVGALQDEFLGRGRPLGAARVLWEIGPDGRDVRTLRSELGLDSGYLSRLLRSLEADSLITVEADEADRRVWLARLTPKGVAERDALDRSPRPAPRDEPRAGGGDRPLPLGRLRGGPGVQRRDLRPPLVREAAPALTRQSSTARVVQRMRLATPRWANCGLGAEAVNVATCPGWTSRGCFATTVPSAETSR
jgi:DNA-binding MarR family transcriptional regulator